MPSLDPATFVNSLGKTIELGEHRTIHRRRYTRHKVRARQPSMLDPHVGMIEGWLAHEPQLTAIAILGRLAERFPDKFGKPQDSTVQRLLKGLRIKAAGHLIASELPIAGHLPADAEPATALAAVKVRPGIVHNLG